MQLTLGKHVVTANKALIAAYLPEIQTALSENPSVSFNYEAAVCGGIPIIHALQSDFFADNITKVMGIMNGTTNFMVFFNVYILHAHTFKSIILI